PFFFPDNAAYPGPVSAKVSFTIAGFAGAKLTVPLESFVSASVSMRAPCYVELMGWVHFIREQTRCQCGHTRGEHRAGPLLRLIRGLLGRSDACTRCPCRSFACPSKL